MNKRLFIAINLPKEIKDQLFNLVLELIKANKNKPIKWVEQDNFHLTLHFLGSVPEEKISLINDALEPIAAKFPSLKFRLAPVISAFPDINDPKIIFLEMKELNDGKTIRLHKEIGEKLKNSGYEIDYRPFRLHLTLGRVKFPTVIKIPNFTIPNSEFLIQSIDLMSSELTPVGPIYSKISQYSLLTNN